MNCEQARQRWHMRFDDRSVDAALEAHLAECEACREYGAQIRQVLGVLDDLREESRQVVARDDALGPQDHARPGRSRWGRTRMAVRWAAMIAIVATASLLYLVQPRDHKASDTNSGATPTTASPIEGITLQGESARQLLAVARPTRQPNVKVYWLYPSLRSETTTE